jgi:hypothetical protein
MTSPKEIDYDDIQIGDEIEKVTVTTADSSYRSAVNVRVTGKDYSYLSSEAGSLYKLPPSALQGTASVKWFLIDRPWSEPPEGSILARGTDIYRHTKYGWRDNNSIAIGAETIRRGLEIRGYTILREGYGQ